MIYSSFVLPDPAARTRLFLYQVTVGRGTPLVGQRRVTELLTFTVQSVKLLSSAAGSRTDPPKKINK